MIQKGDIVQVRPDLEPWKTYDKVVYTNDQMTKYASQKAIVVETFIVHDETDVLCYRLRFLNENIQSS